MQAVEQVSYWVKPLLIKDSLRSQNTEKLIITPGTDTDGNGVSLDADIVRAYYAAVPGALDTSSGKDASAWTVPCDTKLPDLSMAFDGVDKDKYIATIHGPFLMNPPRANEIPHGPLGGGGVIPMVGVPPLRRPVGSIIPSLVNKRELTNSSTSTWMGSASGTGRLYPTAHYLPNSMSSYVSGSYANRTTSTSRNPFPTAFSIHSMPPLPSFSKLPNLPHLPTTLIDTRPKSKPIYPFSSRFLGCNP